jgi:hypothetical protein
VLVDLDRGFINFYKDGHDLGVAFASEDLIGAKLFPFI